jgi:hypothetical protein
MFCAASATAVLVPLMGPPNTVLADAVQFVQTRTHNINSNSNNNNNSEQQHQHRAVTHTVAGKPLIFRGYYSNAPDQKSS